MIKEEEATDLILENDAEKLWAHIRTAEKVLKEVEQEQKLSIKEQDKSFEYVTRRRMLEYLAIAREGEEG